MYNVYIVEGEEDRVVYFDNTVFLFCRFRSGMSHPERSVNIYDTVYCGKHSQHCIGRSWQRRQNLVGGSAAV